MTPMVSIFCGLLPAFNRLPLVPLQSSFSSVRPQLSGSTTLVSLVILCFQAFSSVSINFENGYAFGQLSNPTESDISFLQHTVNKGTDRRHADANAR